MNAWDAFLGPNVGYALELYERYQHDASSVDPATRAFFERAGPPSSVLIPGRDATGTPSEPSPTAAERVASAASETASAISAEIAARIVAAARLARGIREYGHLAAHIDPLGAPPPGDPMLDLATHDLTTSDLAALPASIVWPEVGPKGGSCLDAIDHLREMYSGSLGYDFDHVQDFTERAWLREAVEFGGHFQPLELQERRDLLRRLSEVEAFERFLHTSFQGQKRFSIEGTDMLVPMLDRLIHDASETGAREVLIGMAHRGRLNVLAHVLGKPYAAIFAEFHTAPNKDLVPSEGSMGINYGWTGDVKYHLGAQTTVEEDGQAGHSVRVSLTMAHNPSHLEFVNPVIEGIARAAQDRRAAPGAPAQDDAVALAVAIHGDAAFPGEGVVAETLNLSRLAGYQTGGTVHIIVNNQVGFTTEARQGRSTLYASDLAKGFEIPIIHVNADDPAACLSAIRIAHAYRARFRKDFLVDLVGYRRWGHNEGDEPSFTQPQLYAAIAGHPTVRALYARQLQDASVISAQEADAMLDESQSVLRAAHADVERENHDEPAPLAAAPSLASMDTRVPADTLRALNDALLARPAGFAPVSRLERLLTRRRDALEKPGGIDWAHAEALAFASLLADGTPIRLTGQDSERGTFSQRHLVLHDATADAVYVPHQTLPQARASFAIYNSPLSEAAVLGFEYGYSVHAPDALVLWEAQFGDFANAAQVLLDQFIAAARAKWRQLPSLVLLLPHGYEGQGPEHSSARIERYLQLAAEDNLRVANCTTAAQYFHLLRAQAALLGESARPLVIMTPKSLLRHPRAASSLGDLAEGGFRAVIGEPMSDERRHAVERLILCSGKVAVDIEATAHQDGGPLDWVAVARVELLYPFPHEALADTIHQYPNLHELVWLQEEPHNMGAWTFMAPRLRQVLPHGCELRYVGRPERAASAEGSATAHSTEQARLLEAAFAGERRAKIETHGGQYVG